MNRKISTEKYSKTVLCATILLGVLFVSIGQGIIPKVHAYVSSPMQSGTVTDWYGFEYAASFGTVCKYDASSGSSDPYFFPAMESHSWSYPYPVRQIAQLKITVSGTKPNGQPINGLEFCDLAYLDSPHDTGSEWYYALTDIYNVIVDLLPQPASSLLKYGQATGAGVGWDATSAWAEWNWQALHPLMYDKGLQFRLKLHCDPCLGGWYTLNIVYHLKLFGQNHPSGPGFGVFDNDVATETISYYFIPTTPNSPPNNPSKPSGYTSGYIGHSYSYSTEATDPEGNDVYYKFYWGDGSTTTIGPYPSGTTHSASHTWSSTGTFDIKVKAKDIYGEWSGFSPTLTVTIRSGGGGGGGGGGNYLR